jgi:hypothetical protein
MRVLAAEKVVSFPEGPSLPAVARFEFFRRGDRPAGVWLVRQGALRFALPITSGTKPGVADYLPAPHGLPGFAAPVEQLVPAGATYFELADGRTLAATDGADEIVPGADGRSLRASWRRFVLVGGKTGDRVEPGFEVAIAWRIENGTLKRTETLAAARDVTIRRLSFLLSSTATSVSRSSDDAVVRLEGPEGLLRVEMGRLDVEPERFDLLMLPSFKQLGDEPLGRGPRLPIPTHVTYEARDIQLRAGESRGWTIALTVAPSERTPR